MKKKTVVIVGVGRGMGIHIARTFGEHDCTIVLMSRNAEKLNNYAEELRSAGIEAYAQVADASDPSSLTEAFSIIKKEHGMIDVLVYNAAILTAGMPTKLSNADLMEHYQVDVASALYTANLVLPEQIEHGDGAILFTGGGLGLNPAAEYSCISIDKAALRALAFTLSEEVAPNGVYVGVVTIMGAIAPGTHFDPADIAKLYWQMYERRDRVEYIFE